MALKKSEKVLKRVIFQKKSIYLKKKAKSLRIREKSRTFAAAFEQNYQH